MPPKMLNAKASKKRVTQLKKKGYMVKQVTMPNGDVMVLKKKKPPTKKNN